MITALHLLIYSDDAPATRAFFKDVLQWPFVADDGDSDWLIFTTGPSELGVHPTRSEHGGEEWSAPRHHSVSLMCDDLDATIGDIASRGAQLSGEPMEMGFGRGVLVKVPGADDVLLYQPHHPTAYDRA